MSEREFKSLLFDKSVSNWRIFLFVFILWQFHICIRWILVIFISCHFLLSPPFHETLCSSAILLLSHLTCVVTPEFKKGCLHECGQKVPYWCVGNLSEATPLEKATSFSLDTTNWLSPSRKGGPYEPFLLPWCHVDELKSCAGLLCLSTTSVSSLAQWPYHGQMISFLQHCVPVSALCVLSSPSYVMFSKLWRGNK